MSMRNKWLIALSVAILAVACAKNNEDSPKGNVSEIGTGDGTPSNMASMEQGYVRIKVDENLAKTLSQAKSENGVLMTKAGNVNQAISLIGITEITRTFPEAGEFEARTKAEGLDLWYDVKFDKETALTKAGSDLENIDGVTIVEYRPVARLTDGADRVRYISESEIPNKPSDYEFNDPLLSKQWHYYNDGTVTNSIKGADINLFPAWQKYTKGSSTVIVSVVDGGIDWEHEDLSANMWTNPNGSSDGLHGWNFMDNSPNLTVDDHGTHVAGTIAAVNDNGIGVCGVAGGDYAKGEKGVQLMSCQIISGEESRGGGATAIKWSADHGAVISQNSWGYEGLGYVPQSDKDAIDYFIKYAGYDSKGNQVGPMAGGVVIFAGGNETIPHGYPAEYENAIAVGAMAADYAVAYYSNYGDWVDICAPGGDLRKGAGVLSTLPGNKYGEMQGTSMACPHVSGVAALIVSKYGGPGFTNERLKQLLLNTSRDISQYATGIGKLVDAFAALSAGSNVPPEKITDLKASVLSNTITCSFSVPADEDDVSAAGATIYYSKSAITTQNILSCDKKSINLASNKTGDKVSLDLEGLEFSTKYYLAAIANDNSGNKSDISNIVVTNTKTNNAPVITALEGLTKTYTSTESGAMSFQISDPDNHSCQFSMTPKNVTGFSTKVVSGNTIQLLTDGPEVIRAQSLDNADHVFEFTLTVTDAYKASLAVKITITVKKNNAPTIVKRIDDTFFENVGDTQIPDMDSFFKDEDGGALSYSLESSDSQIVRLIQEDSKVHIVAVAYGTSKISVSASDIFGKKVTTTFRVLVRNAQNEIDLYPNPVKDVLNVRMGKNTTGVISIYNTLGAKVTEQSIAVSPFDPAIVDMRDLAAGEYSVVFKCEGKEIKRNIIKL